MTRPLRIDFPGAVYHVTSRGNRRAAIFEDDTDASLFLKVLGEALQRFNAQALAYCLMTNHYHLVIVTPQGGLSLLMRQINGVYSQTYNRRHGVTGHLLQGRFKAILVDHDAYLTELCRYGRSHEGQVLTLNPLLLTPYCHTPPHDPPPTNRLPRSRLSRHLAWQSPFSDL